MKKTNLGTSSISEILHDSTIENSLPLTGQTLLLPQYSRYMMVADDEQSSSMSPHSEGKFSFGIEREFILQEPVFIKTIHPKKMVVLQKWEGIVQEVLTDSFIARLTDKSRQIEEEAEMLIEDIDKKDIELLEPGAVFYWSIGYDDEISRERFSKIKFRRLPTWDKEELEFINRDSNRIRELIGWK